jgi:hypothetical protein
MLRKAAFVSIVIVAAWWMRGGDPQSLKHDLLAASNSQTQFAPDGVADHGDWGD